MMESTGAYWFMRISPLAGRGLSGGTWRVARTIGHYCKASDGNVVKIEAVAAEAGVSRRTVQRAIRELEANQLVYVHRKPGRPLLVNLRNL